MKAGIWGVAAIASVALLAGIGQASAVTASACSGNEYTAANGTTSLTSPTNLGTIGSGCLEIGPFNNNNVALGSNNGPGVVNTSGANPSIYQFTWGGGLLTIQEELGNNGSGHDIDIELGLASGNSLTANKGLTNNLASVSILLDPNNTGPGAPIYVIQNYNLAAGVYLLDTFLGSTCNTPGGCGADTAGDPQYQVLFTPGTQGDTSATPLPERWRCSVRRSADLAGCSACGAGAGRRNSRIEIGL